MLVPVKWLLDYIDLDEDTRIIADKVTDTGSHVEAIEEMSRGIENIKVGQILDIRPHESLKKLSLVDLDLGDQKLQLVTGAKNMKIKDKVVVALLGARLPGGIEISEADFDGVKSPGMLCSYEELGIDEALVPKKSKDGIIILSDDVEVGMDGLEALGLQDQVIEFEITPNRPDCLSIIGMAREVAAAFDKKIVLPDQKLTQEEGQIEDYFKGLEVQTKNVGRFNLRVIKDVVIKESPQWIKNYLIKAGMRPINNIVDLTNFIMLEYGQPLHAYDLDRIEGKSLLVRMANEGEKLVTLDKNERTLNSSDILICDGNSKAIGLAGVMGGLHTEVEDTTKTILLEAASFNPENIRQTSKRLGLRSEASTRFEKKVALELAEIASERFCHLIEKTGSGKVVKKAFDFYPNVYEDKEIILRNKRSNDLLGIDLGIEETARYLEALELKVQLTGDEMKVRIPYFRKDLNIEADLIEEVGRLYGFHNIEAKPLRGALSQGLKSEKREFIDQLRLDIYALGFSEIMTYSFISEKIYDKLNLDKESKLRDYIKIMNPLGEDFSVMRTTLLGNMLDVVRKNLNNKREVLRFSEVGNSFHRYDGQIVEEALLTLAMVGNYDFYYIKNILENLFDKYGVKNYSFETEKENPIFHTTRCAKVLVDGEVIAYVGEVHPLVLQNFDISKRVYATEVNISKLLKYVDDQKTYQTVSKYPMIERDIALVVDKDVKSVDIIDLIRRNGGENLREIQLFDIYTGEQIDQGKKSLAYKIGFQSDQRTLKDKEVKEAFEKILESLNERFGINLRG
ncbi:MAG: phenylalanine--tRNA ligase subunit beta [Tissierellia bacterium]|nr:phenylalanine--tRNA ligase subunit beta [Tissierellia bacterium]